jgi:uncharacterized metal-binding protein YceD (DUF177 family)
MGRPAKVDNTQMDKTIDLDTLDTSKLSVSELLALRQLQRIEKEDAEKELQEKQNMQMRKENAMAMDRQRKDAMLNQNHCQHLKENGRTNLAGQRDHQRVIHLVCQRCGKEFTGQVDYHLMPKAEAIGGPNF